MRAQGCVHGALSKGALQADNWCQPQTEDLGDGASYTFQISSPSTVTTSTGLSVDQRKVVSYGTVNGVRRRAVVTVNAGHGAPPSSRPAMPWPCATPST